MRQYTLAVAIAAVTATNAFAADLPYRKGPPVIAPVMPAFTWTGAYIGVNAGYLDGRNKAITAPDGASTPLLTQYLASQFTVLGAQRTRLNGSGFTGGGQLGYNYQITPGSGLVVGIEADAQYVDAKRKRLSSYSFTQPSVAIPGGTFSDTFTYSQKDQLDFLGTVRGRIGYAFDRVLIFGTGGLAYGNVNYRGQFTDAYSWSSGISGYTNISSKSNNIQVGYAYGGGIEYAIPTDSFLNVFKASAVTVKAEYLHYDLGSRKIAGVFSTGGDVPSSNSSSVTKLTTNGDIFRAGLNYKFGSY
ncbi:outer membrane protein [Methylobacterium aerolatum]|uniref:Outer membrane immunogenic protein n=1 Tax=Methylobacterium aerolatum TaxID=418708 RepID=A0ABU0HTP6_9HYPH|nr:porin family protein [Methylobacterium aerolatum]MDQ0445703.1 outer membrane immunogenic protein [Methylobacterium aerolatum]GJD36187.1 hypothetical protein FMGBMHLM_3102 [Methylobacterium aerolatum]